jgi:hypothetical protein
MNAENSQIVKLLKEEFLNFNANNEINNHESRREIKFTKNEDS